MEDFLKAIWTNDFIVKEKTEEQSPVFLWSKNKKKAKKEKKVFTDEELSVKQERHRQHCIARAKKERQRQWYIENDIPWFCCIYKLKDWFFYKRTFKTYRKLARFLRMTDKNFWIEISHFRPVESIALATVRWNQVWKKFKTELWYILSDELREKLLTFTK